MACKHTNIDCGCKDSFLTTPAPCPTPDDCPDTQPCSEVFDSQCIVYTGANITCGQSTVVPTNSQVSGALQDIVDYFCTLTSAMQQQITNLTNQLEECCSQPATTPFLVEITKQGDFNRYTAVISGGSAASYTWTFSSTHNGVDTAPDNSMYTLTPQMSSAQIWYADNVSIPQIFDACASSNVARIGLLQVTVVSTDGRVAKDYKLITTIVCA